MTVEVADRGASKASFGERHRGSAFADVYGKDKGYVDMMMRQNEVGPAALFGSIVETGGLHGISMNNWPTL